MNILIRQFMGKNHSWCVVGQGISDGMIANEQSVDIFSTDGIDKLPNHLKHNLIGYVEENNTQVFGRSPNINYDAQISYTAPKNWQLYLNNGIKNKIGIWAFEFSGKNVLPLGFSKYYQHCSVVVPPSNFVKEIFMSSGMPENHIKVIPHGINANNFKKISKIKLPTKKKCIILANIAQNHLRKNIDGLLDVYGKSFTNRDDVCLLIKAKDKKPTQPFEVSLGDILKHFKEKYKNHAEVKLYSEYIEDISDLYRSVDIVFTLSKGEGFYFPGIEAAAAGKISVCPNHGGQKDFLNQSNSLLIDTKIGRADLRALYWGHQQSAEWGIPSIDDAVSKLRFAYQNYESLNAQVELQRENILQRYDWKNIAKQFINLCDA